MPVYKYRGVTEKGQVISNRIEMDSKQKVIDKLKENNIMPIDITQVGISLRKNKHGGERPRALPEPTQGTSQKKFPKNPQEFHHRAGFPTETRPVVKVFGDF